MASKKTLLEKIIAGVKKDGMSATALAKSIGYTKAAQIMSDLTEAVKAGSVIVNSSGRFPLYSKGEAKTAVKKADDKSKTTIVEGEKPKGELPEASKKEMAGYRVSNIRHKKKAMKKVTTPDGRKIRIENDEQLMVINGSPKYVVKTSQDVIKCIRKYAVDNKMTTFTVNDIKMNKKVTNDKDVEIKDGHLMFLSIRKHNKAA